MSERKFNPEAETCAPRDFTEKVRMEAERLRGEQERQRAEREAARLGSQKTEKINTTPFASENPDRVRKSSRAGIAATLALGLMASSAATTAGYMYVYKKGPFAPVEIPAPPSATAAGSEKPAQDGAPEEVTNSNDLRKILESKNIRATDKDFDFATEKPQLHARALIFKVENKPDESENIKYSWVPVRNRITRVNENELLVAVKIINKYVKDNPSLHLAPEGLSYRASVADEQDPTVIYFYYDCRDKIQPELLGQIGLKNPQNPKKLLWGVSFSIPDCK